MAHCADSIQKGKAMKKLISLLVVLAMIGTLIACGSSAQSSAEPQSSASEEAKSSEAEKPAEESKAEESKEEPAEEAPAEEAPAEEGFNWKGSGKLVVYSCDPTDMCEARFAAFTELTGVEVEPVYGGGGELLARIAAESANPMCDIITGVTSDNSAAYQEYLQKYKLQTVTPEEIGRTTLEEDYCTYGASGNPMVFIVNTDVLAEEDIPYKWADLIDEKYFGNIAFTDPNASSSAYIQINVMEQLYGWDFVEKFYKNLDGKMLNSSSAVPRQCADGEYGVALTVENQAADYAAAGDNIKVIYPEDGTMRAIGGIYMVKNGPNPDNAKLFEEFWYTKEASEITVSFNRRGERVDVDLPAGFAPFSEIKFMNYDYEKAANSAPILEKWNEIVVNNS